MRRKASQAVRSFTKLALDTDRQQQYSITESSAWIPLTSPIKNSRKKSRQPQRLNDFRYALTESRFGKRSMWIKCLSHSDCHLPSLLTSNSAYQSPSPELQKLDSAQSISRYSKWAANLKEGLFLLYWSVSELGELGNEAKQHLQTSDQRICSRIMHEENDEKCICFAEYDFCFGCHPKKGKQQLLHICSACFLQACCMSPSGVKSSLSSLFTTWER